MSIMMHTYTHFWAVPFGMFGLFALGSILVGLIAILSIVLKGYSLWHAAQRNERGWFVALLLINTLGILELVYLYFIVGKWKNAKTKVDDKTPL